MDKERWRMLLATVLLLAFLCWSIPTCIRGPVLRMDERTSDFDTYLKKHGLTITSVHAPGGSGFGIITNNPNGRDCWGLGIGISTSYVYIDGMENQIITSR